MRNTFFLLRNSSLYIHLDILCRYRGAKIKMMIFRLIVSLSIGIYYYGCIHIGK